MILLLPSYPGHYVNISAEGEWQFGAGSSVRNVPCLHTRLKKAPFADALINMADHRQHCRHIWP